MGRSNRPLESLTNVWIGSEASVRPDAGGRPTSGLALEQTFAGKRCHVSFAPTADIKSWPLASGYDLFEVDKAWRVLKWTSKCSVGLTTPAA